MAGVTLLGVQTFTTASGTKSVTATPAVNDLIVIVTAHSGNTSSAAPTDDQSGTYTLINSAVKATSADTMRVWVRDSLITSAVSTIFTHAPGASSGGGLAVAAVTGMTRVGSAAARQSAKQDNQAASTTPAPAFGAAALTGNPVITAVFNASNPAGVAVRSSPAYTSLVNDGYATPVTGLRVAKIDSGDTASTITWGGTSATEFGSLALELDTSSSGVTGTGAVTLSAVTVAGTGERSVTGSGAITLGSVAVASTANRSYAAAGAITLGAVTVEGTGERSVTGTGSVALGAVTVAGTGTVSGAGTVTGTGAVTLSAVTVEGTGERSVTGTGAITLGSVAVAATANRSYTATGAITLGGIQVSGLGAGVELEPARQRGAGRRRRRKYVVEIDGQEFVVDGVEQAQALLERARDVARRAAESQAEAVVAKAITKARRGPPPKIQIDAPRIKVDPEIAPQVASQREAIRAVYRAVAMEAEIKLLLRLEQERDDEEVLLLL